MTAEPAVSVVIPTIGRTVCGRLLNRRWHKRRRRWKSSWCWTRMAIRIFRIRGPSRRCEPLAESAPALRNTSASKRRVGTSSPSSTMTMSGDPASSSGNSPPRRREIDGWSRPASSFTSRAGTRDRPACSHHPRRADCSISLRIPDAESVQSGSDIDAAVSRALVEQVPMSVAVGSIHDDPKWLIEVRRAFPDLPIIQVPEPLVDIMWTAVSVSRPESTAARNSSIGASANLPATRRGCEVTTC